MRETFTAMRWGAGFVVLAAVLGAIRGIAHGIQLATANQYRQQGLTNLSSWVVLDSTRDSMVVWALAALAILAAVIVIWPIARALLGNWRRGFIGAVAAILVLSAYLFAAWYVNRFLLPGFRSVSSVVGNLLLLAAAVAAWYGIVRIIEKVRLPERVAWCGALARPVPVVLMLLAVLGVQTAHAFARPAVQQAAPNVLLIVIDALRPDRLGAYGYQRDTSPNLDRFARESWLFTQAVTTAPWTKPAVASLLTGLPPRRHGISSAAQWSRRDEQGVAQVAALSRSLTTLPEWLANAGYRTGAFGENHHLVAKLGFDQGFDVHHMDLIDQSFLEAMTRRLGLGVSEHLASRGDRNTAKNIDRHFLNWQAQENEPFFAYVHHIDVHWPYRAPAEFARRFGERRTKTDFNSMDFYAAVGPERVNADVAPQIDPAVLQDMSNAYDAGIAFVDAELGALFAELRKRGIYDNTLIIVTADHGEQFLEHGEIGHGTSLHDVLLRVPLMIKFPCPGSQCGARRIDSQVQLVDVVPTVLSTAGIQVPNELPGRNVTGPLDADRVVYAEKGDQVALRTREFKMIYHIDESRTELFSLQQDPGEQHDLAGAEPQLTAALRDRLIGWLEESEQQAVVPHEEVSADSEMLDRLKALGYVE
jgi:arylsulfatase A-like enzyme